MGNDTAGPTSSRTARGRPSGAGAATLPTDVLPLAETERRAITRALDAAGNNVTRAALALGINRTTLHRKLKKYDLPTAEAG